MSQDKVFIVGDIHGCFNEWMELLKKASYNPKEHRMILVGDLINKGPDSFKTLQWCYDNKIEVVIGNHELKFIQYIKENLPLPPCFAELKRQMGIDLQKWIQYIQSWPSYIEEKDFMVVHGGLVPHLHPKDSSLLDLVNIRNWDETNNRRSNKGTAWYKYYKKKKLVIYGHWAVQGLHKTQNSIGLDSGCVYGRKLSGVWLPSQIIVQVDSHYSTQSSFYS